MPVVVLFFGAMAGAALGLSAAVPWPVLAVFVVVSAGGALFASTRPMRIVAVVGASVALAAASATLHLRLARRELPTTVVVVEGVVVDTRFGDEGQKLVVDVDSVLAGIDTGWAPLSLRLDVDLINAHVEAGAHLRLRGRIHEPTPSLSPGTFDGLAWALSRGVHGHMGINDPRDVVVIGQGASPFFAGLRLQLRERLMAQLTPREAGLLLALLIGDTSLFDEEQKEAYRHVGAGHLLAVSGLQVTLLAVLLLRLSMTLVLLTPPGRRGRGFVVASAVAVAGIWGFVFLCGCPPSAVRAGVMATLVVLAQALGRRVTLLDVLGAAGFLTVMLSPTSVLDAGFLLSYAAVLGLAAAAADAPLSSSSSRSLWATVKPALTASLVAGIVTLPLSAWMFGQVAPAGLIANVVLVPVASALQLPALVGGALGAFFDWPWLSFLGAEAALLLESLVFGLADVLPGVAPIDAPSALVATTLTTTALLTAAALLAGRRALGVILLVMMVVGIGVSRSEPGGMRITFLPVGQGDCAVVELPDGSVFVIDGGGRVPFDDRLDEEGRAEVLAESGTRVLLPYLRRRGIDVIDVMVLSHPHPDHAGGLRAVAGVIPVRQFWWAGERQGPLVRPLFHALEKKPHRGESTQVKSTPGLIGRFHFGDVTVDALAPAPAERTPTYPELHANDNSLVLRFCLHGGCALFPGDIERYGEEFLLATNDVERVRAQLVKAPHHGSRTSSSAEFVSATAAKDVVLCTGRHNTFGFPAPEVVQRWEKSGARLWNTAEQGEVTFWIDGATTEARSFRR